MSERGKWLAAGMAMLALLSGNMALAQAKRTDDRVLMKPDLRIVSFVAERTGLNADGSHRVRLSVNVRCAGSFPGSCGAFKIRVERSDSATGPRTFLGEGGVASLGTGYGMVTAPIETRTFEDTVRHGSTRHYAARVDSGGTIDETNENNNTAQTTYSATGCTGVDLIVTQVEAIRATRSEGVVFHVWVRNRCLEACRGDLEYTVTPVSPASAAVSQGIGGGLEGEQTAGPLGSILTTGRRGIDLAYEVGVSVSGGTCRETSTTNNVCRVRLLSTEDRKTVRCGS
jgi:hypothetical protein